MKNPSTSNLNLLAAGLFLGLCALGYLLGNAAIRVKEYERTVTVKGLSEREVPADVVIWPIAFTEASTDLDRLYIAMETNADKVIAYLADKGIDQAEVSVAAPMVTDKSAQQWGGGDRPEFRYTGTRVVTVYSREVDKVREAMQDLVELGKQGLVFSTGNYEHATEYQFSGLNDIKPAMIEEATVNARAVAEKFARDSASKVGKIRRASQGQFTISDRDKNNPHIKNVRVVSTIEYYLAD
jgi:hypothetical protein